jgi:hypothetical protein
MRKNVLNNVAVWIASLGCVLSFACKSSPALADDAPSRLNLPGFRVAQFDADDTYDPFADYSEFDEAQDEEADINFFRHGRFVTLAFLGGMRGFTQGLGEMYTPAFDWGLALTYFFDLRFAMQFSYQTSSHPFYLSSGTVSATGTIGIEDFALDIKYYINTQNVSKGLANFNPYLIGGIRQVTRTSNINGVDGFGKEGAMGFGVGAGIELPLLRNKMFIGIQGLYEIINFQDKNTEIVFVGQNHTGMYPNGDSYTGLFILGVNF